MKERLIDANALKKYVDGCEFCNNCQRKKNRCAFDCVLPDYLTSEWERVIDEQPTVDAVPVKWIQSYVKRLEDNGNTFAAVQYEMMIDDYLADGERRTE